ncbi:MAG: alpha/beta fold hydrolase [Rhodospirillales bacterium]|nr:alpha/beta fold hydrolase [Rhodospirillales bacterium]
MDWIEVNGAALRYEVSGSGERTLVLIHEMGGTLESWDGVLARLPDGLRVLRYDTRGAGLSEKIRGSVSFDTMAADLAALLDARRISGRVVLAGVAVGAGIALHFAARHPARIAGVVAMAPATGVVPERRAATLARADAMAANGPRAGAEEGFAASYPEVMRGDGETFRRFRARWLGNDPESYAAIYRMLAEARVSEELPGIACPVLLMAGNHDALRPPALIEPLARTMRDARFRAVESAHYMAVQTPDLVAEAITAFLAEIGF